MPDFAYIRRSLTGAWLLAKFDPRGMELFDLSIEGFWRSFFAAVVAIPALILLYMARNPIAWSLQGLFGDSLLYAVDWATLPIFAIPLTRILGLSQRYVALIIATNWASVLQLSAFAALVLILGILPASVQGFVFIMGVCAILFYDWFVIRTALETSVSIALGILIIDLFLGFMISQAFGY